MTAYMTILTTTIDRTVDDRCCALGVVSNDNLGFIGITQEEVRNIFIAR